MEFKKLLKQMLTLYDKLTIRQKIVIAIAIVAVIGFIVFLVVTKEKKGALNEGYAVLFDKVNASDSALIVEELEKSKIPYELVNEGTIAVPQEEVYKQRIAIAALGIPKNSNVGFEIFDKNEFGATDFEQKIKYLRALEGELARTIESLGPIEKANVHIAIPKETVFADKKRPATASVAISVGDKSLSFKQITGIKNLVASSVANLSAKDVTVVDQNGVPLGDEDSESYEADIVKHQVRYRTNFERNLEEKILKVISPVVGGKDKVVAKVTAEFDFAREDSVSEVYDPNSVPRSEQSMEEKREGFKPKDIGGVPGAVSNIGPVQGIKDDGLKEKHEKNTSTTNYEISKKVTNVKGEYATLKRLTVAVVVDGDYKKETKDDGNGNTITEDVYIPLDPNSVKAIENVVKQTVGYSTKRGDEVTVSNLQFKPDSDEIRMTKLQELVLYLEPLIPVAKYFLASIFLFVFYKKMVEPFSERMLEHVVIEEDASENEDESMGDIEIDKNEDTLEKFKNARRKVEKQLGFDSEIDEDQLKFEVLVEKLKSTIMENAEEVANVIGAVIASEKEAAKTENKKYGKG